MKITLLALVIFLDNCRNLTGLGDWRSLFEKKGDQVNWICVGSSSELYIENLQGKNIIFCRFSDSNKGISWSLE